MKNLIIKPLVILFTAFLLIFSSGDLFAQRNIKAKERIQQVKKIKLLEILELDEKTADKFLVKFSFWESKIMAHRDATDLLADELDIAIRKNADKSEIVKLTNQYLEKMSEFHKIISERNNDVKSILNEHQFAKFLIFEDRFIKDVQKVMFKMMKGRDGDDDMPPPPRKRK